MLPTLLAASPAQYFFGILLTLTATFLVLLVLVQRGRGGGLAGAFGGMGGQSAFGTKAGDLFTKVTIGVAAGWILLCILTIVVLNRQSSGLLGDPGAPPPAMTSPDGEGAATEDEAGQGAATDDGLDVGMDAVEPPSEDANIAPDLTPEDGSAP